MRGPSHGPGLGRAGDFKDYEFVKLLKREPVVADKIRRGDLPLSLLDRLYIAVGGTPRFLVERIRPLLLTFTAVELAEALEGVNETLAAKRDEYLQEIFGPRLFEKLSAQRDAW